MNTNKTQIFITTDVAGGKLCHKELSNTILGLRAPETIRGWEEATPEVQKEVLRLRATVEAARMTSTAGEIELVFPDGKSKDAIFCGRGGPNSIWVKEAK